MMRPAFLALVMLAMPCQAKGPAPSYQHDPSAIVQVFCASEQGTALGTAIRVTHNGYITARHVVALGKCTIVGEAGGPITVTYSDEKTDFATFIGPEGRGIIPISCDGFVAGRIYVARGYAGGNPYDVLVPWLATDLTDGPKTLFLGDAIPGMSGGPLIDRAGRVVGIVNQHTASRSLPLSLSKVCRA